MIETLVNLCPHKDLLDAYHKKLKKEFTQEQLTDACVDWSYKYLSHYEFKSDPPMPDTLDTYNRLNITERKSMAAEFAEKVERQKKGYEYGKSIRRSENIANKSFLIDMVKSFLRRNKLEELSKIEDVLAGHETYGIAEEKEYEKTSVEVAKKMFKGEVRQWTD